jgi:hypothetical protein
MIACGDCFAMRELQSTSAEEIFENLLEGLTVPAPP